MPNWTKAAPCRRACKLYAHTGGPKNYDPLSPADFQITPDAVSLPISRYLNPSTSICLPGSPIVPSWLPRVSVFMIKQAGAWHPSTAIRLHGSPMWLPCLSISVIKQAASRSWRPAPVGHEMSIPNSLRPELVEGNYLID